MFKKFVTDYLSFTKKERRGIFALLTSIVFFTALPFFYSLFIPHKKYDHSQFEKEIAALEIKRGDADSNEISLHPFNSYHKNYPPYKSNEEYKTSKTELFYFDPNTLPAEGWKKLGIREKTIETIQKYISKGARFKEPGDISKIWGLHEDDVKRLLPYVAIQQSAENKSELRRSFEKKEHEIKPFDINLADTAAFIALPGIGAKLAARIISFREKLGGFYKVEQVGETFGLPDSVFKNIKVKLLVNAMPLKKININTATQDELKRHPYIRYVLANAIVQYRTQHGKFATIDDLKKIMIITDEIFGKLAPYLVTQ